MTMVLPNKSSRRARTRERDRQTDTKRQRQRRTVRLSKGHKGGEMSITGKRNIGTKMKTKQEKQQGR